MKTGVTTTSLAMALILSVPGHVAAAPADPAVEEAQALFQEGDLKYQASNYLEAVHLFEGAYSKAAEIDDAEQRKEVMTALLYNLAQGHTKAFDVDGDTSHLRQAKDLVAKYLNAEISSDDRTRGELLKDEVQAKLGETEAEGSVEDPAPPTLTEAPAMQDETPLARPQLNGLMIGGVVLSSLSAVGIGVMTGGFLIGNKATDDYYEGPDRSDRDDADQRGQMGNTLALAGGIAASALLSLGVALIVLGKKKRDPGVALVPSVGTDVAALMLRGQF